MSLFATYKYTNDELKRALLSIQFPPYSYYLLSVIGIFSSVGITIEIISFGIKNFSIGFIAFIFAFLVALFIFSIWLISISPKHAREMKELFGSEQTVSITGGNLTYTAGTYEFEIGSQYIYKIVNNGYFYILKLYITRYDFDYNYKFYSNPQIPIHIIQESQIVDIARELKIPYICKNRRIE